MNFQQAEDKFRELDRQFRSGQISAEVYRAALQALRVKDAQGRVWQMQEETGKWYVLERGRWTPAAGPNQEAAGPALSSARQVGVSRPAVADHPSRKPRFGIWLGIGGVAVVGIACLIVIGVGAILFRDGLPSLRLPGGMIAGQDSASLPEAYTFGSDEMLTIAPGSGPQTDEHGVSLTVPQGAAGEGQQAVLTAGEPDSRLDGALADGYAFDTPFYAVAAQGEVDGTGRAELSFPASSPDSRLVAVVDGVYLAVLDVQPEAGALHLRPRLSAQGEAVPGMGSSVRYAVLTPTGTAGRVPAPGPGSLHLASLATADASRDCTSPAFEGVVLSVCRKDPSGSVYLEFVTSVDLSVEQADRVVDDIAATMKRYAALGFTAANISASNPAHIVVFQGSGDPEYSFKTGVIYIPLDVARSMGSAPRHDLYHELAHWIQDEEYVMLLAGIRGAGRWWMETSAENMVMLLDNAYVSKNLTTYGALVGTEPMQVLQSSPYQWPSDFYAQAQLVKVNMCDSASCAISQASFVKAINEGTYPFDDAGAQAKVSANLHDYARYLLGVAPEAANSAIPLTGAVSTGVGYGEEVNISETTKGLFQITADGIEPQMRQETVRGLQAEVVQAKLEKDGVYVFRVTSGRNDKYAGLPAVLTVSPGAAYWYRVDGGAPQYNDGTEELVIQPIQNALGIKDVRIVAMSRTGNETFNARLESVNLEGVWLFKPERLVSSSIACSENTKVEGGASELPLLLINLGSAFGNYRPDSTSPALNWELDASRLSSDVSASDFTYTGQAQLGTKDLTVKALMDIPRPAESSTPRVPWAAGLFALVPFGVGTLFHRRVPRIVALFAVIMLLTGCISLIIYGKSSGDFTFTKLEYLGGEETAVYDIENYPTTTPLWHLSGGTAVLQVDLNIETSSEDESGKTTTQTDVCSGTATYEVSGDVFKDVTPLVNGE